MVVDLTTTTTTRAGTSLWLLLAAAVLVIIIGKDNTANAFVTPTTKCYTCRYNIDHDKQNIKHKAILEATIRSNEMDRRQQRQRLTPMRKNTDFADKGSTTDSVRVNRLLIQAESAAELLSILQSQKGALSQFAGGDTINSVNLSTALHRLAKHSMSSNASSSSSTNVLLSQQQYHQQRNLARAQILADPRFALLLAAVAEGVTTKGFASRENANACWALAKLKIVPPLSAMPNTIQTLSGNKDDCDEHLREMATKVRQAVLQASKEQQKMAAHDDGSRSSSLDSSLWIPSMSILAGTIFDYVAMRMLKPEEYRVNGSDNNKKLSFRQQELSNLLWAWATAGRADPDVFAAVSNYMIAQQQQRQQPPQLQQQQQQRSRDLTEYIRPQEWSNSIWAFATAQVYQGSEQIIIYMADLFQNLPGFVESFKPQEISNTLWSLATLLSNKSGDLTREEGQAALVILRIAAKFIVEHAGWFKSQEMSNSVWAFATLGFGLSSKTDSTANNYLILDSDQVDKDQQLMIQAVEAILPVAENVLPRFRSQELNNLSWALARLVGNKAPMISSMFREIGLQLCDRKRHVGAQDIGTTIWSFAASEFFDSEVYRGLAYRLTPDVAHTYQPQAISNVVWAIATAGIEITQYDAFDTSLVPAEDRPKVTDPIVRCFAIAANELMARPHEFKPQEIKDVLWSFSTIGIRHPNLFKSVAEHLVGPVDGKSSIRPRGLDDFSPQGIVNLAWAYARQAQLVEETSARLDGSLSGSTGRLGVYSTSNIDIGEALIQKLFATIAETNLRIFDQLSKLAPQDLTNTCWTFAVLGLKHNGFLQAARVELVDRLDRLINGERSNYTLFKGQEIANMLWAFAILNVSPGYVLDKLVPFIDSVCKMKNCSLSAAGISTVLKRQELANLAWSCAVFGIYPSRLMTSLYIGLLGGQNESDPAYLSKIYGDNGLQSQALMTLVYVQAALDLEGHRTDTGLVIPDDFPENWKQSKSSSFTSQHMTETFELQLSTSKIQKAVSKALLRVGLDHVEEHVITMEQLATEYGVNVPKKAFEIISIDIANIEKRIAIEVDGPAHFINTIDEHGSTPGFTKGSNGKFEYQYCWDGQNQSMNGPTALKERLLELLGWKVLHVPFWEWYRLTDEKAEEAYCRRLLSTTDNMS